MAKETAMGEPTAEGRRRQPPDGIYRGEFQDDPDMWHACTCLEACPPACKGACGCVACATAYGDYGLEER